MAGGPYSTTEVTQFQPGQVGGGPGAPPPYGYPYDMSSPFTLPSQDPMQAFSMGGTPGGMQPTQSGLLQAGGAPMGGPAGMPPSLPGMGGMGGPPPPMGPMQGGGGAMGGAPMAAGGGTPTPGPPAQSVSPLLPQGALPPQVAPPPPPPGSPMLGTPQLPTPGAPPPSGPQGFAPRGGAKHMSPLARFAAELSAQDPHRFATIMAAFQQGITNPQLGYNMLQDLRKGEMAAQEQQENRAARLQERELMVRSQEATRKAHDEDQFERERERAIQDAVRAGSYDTYVGDTETPAGLDALRAHTSQHIGAASQQKSLDNVLKQVRSRQLTSLAGTPFAGNEVAERELARANREWADVMSKKDALAADIKDYRDALIARARTARQSPEDKRRQQVLMRMLSEELDRTSTLDKELDDPMNRELNLFQGADYMRQQLQVRRDNVNKLIEAMDIPGLGSRAAPPPAAEEGEPAAPPATPRAKGTSKGGGRARFKQLQQQLGGGGSAFAE